MSKVLHVVLQGLALVTQYGTMATHYVPDKYKPLVVAVVAIAQAVLAITNHKAAPNA